MKKADLHVHTVFSDGKLTPRQVIEEANRKGIAAVGITDHDTMRGIPQALKAGRELKVEVVPGVELSTDCDGEEIHILGYYCQADHNILKNTLTHIRMDRYNRIKKMMDRLNEMGIKLVLEDVLAMTAKGESLGRPHVAAALCKQGYCKTPREAFQRFLEKGKPAFVKRLKIYATVAIQLIRKAGGVAVLAHPGLYKKDNLIPKLIPYGLKGLEAFHPNHNLTDCRRYCRIAQKYNLLITGGSDYHGQDPDSGSSLATFGVDYHCLQILKQAAGIKK